MTTQNWFIIDVKGKTLGRAASQVAFMLRGKNKPTFAPHVANSDCYIIINAKDIVVTGNKLDQKEYISHSGFMGGIKRLQLKKAMETKPEWVFTEAVKGMLPKNKLQDIFLKQLRVFAAEEHTHSAQKPQVVTIN